MTAVRVLYFASLRDAAGVDAETVAHDGDLHSLYDLLRQRHALPLPQARLRVAVDGAFAQWDAVPRDGAEVAFIPPVSGG